ncbi:PDZ domain-containing protein, partial [bacterium]|nr:PDZ domain-containing protein [candidate division CSSED10-310 bacterium]
LRAAVDSVAGSVAVAFLDDLVSAPGDMNIETALDDLGLRVTPKYDCHGGCVKSYLGAVYRVSDGRIFLTRVPDDSPAQRGGLAPGDEILACNGFRVVPERFSTRLQDFEPGCEIEVLVSRMDRIKRLSVRLGEKPPVDYLLSHVEQPTPEQKRRYESWLRIAWPGGGSSSSFGGRFDLVTAG